MAQVYDIIIAGGGATACVIAGRLTTTDPSLKILVIERGQHSRDDPKHVQPFRYVEHIPRNGTTTTSYRAAEPSPHLNGRRAITWCGRSVGGGSAVNFMVYVRGAASDYDDWAAFGNEGWSFNELLPFIKKLETFTPVPGRSTHGYSGPIQISSSAPRIQLGISKQFLKVAKEYDPERPQVDDNNDFATPNAYSPAYQYTNAATGRRSDAASAYLYPHLGNPNLTILVGTCVKRVIIENGRAVGVEYIEATGSGELVMVKANKLVIVSAGAFGSPSILERSGIGAPFVLAKNNVPIQVNLPGVGENYQDHVGSPQVCYASDETDTMDDVWDNPDERAAWEKEWEKNGTGKLGHNGIEAVAKVRLTEAQLKSGGPALQERWETFFRNRPDKPMAIIIPFAGFPMVRSLTPGRKLLSTFYSLLYPESTGSVHITSAEDVNSHPDFDCDFLSKAGDVAQFTVWYKMTRELMRRLPAYRGEIAAYHPQFPAGSAATCKETDVHVPINAPDIVYSKEDDEAIELYHRRMIGSIWHSLGTCAMKPRDQGGVVDARLNVYRVKGLKVADLSICPTNVGNNTYSTALLIGEKAASIIAEDLGYEARSML